MVARTHLLDVAPIRETLQIWTQAAERIAEGDLAERDDIDADSVTTVLDRNLFGDILMTAFRGMTQERRDPGGERLAGMSEESRQTP